MRSTLRTLLAVGLVAGAAVLAAPVHAAEGHDAAIELKDEQLGDAYLIEARFGVRRSQAAVRKVLTDYERLPSFVEGLRESVVTERSSNRTVVAQTAEARALFFSRTMRVRLEILEEKDLLTFRDLSLTDFDEYEGTWSLKQKGDVVQVVYRLRAKPKVMIPAFIVRSAFRNNALGLLEALRAELNKQQAPVEEAPEDGS